MYYFIIDNRYICIIDEMSKVSIYMYLLIVFKVVNLYFNEENFFLKILKLKNVNIKVN